MSKIKDIIRCLKANSTLSNRQICDITKADRDLISKIRKFIDASTIQIDDLINMDDGELYLLVYPNNVNIKYVKPEPDLDYIINELNSNKTLTLKLCHDEYLAMHPDGLGYTQFCERIRSRLGSRNIRMHIERKPGEKMYVDWVGDTMSIVDSNTNEKITVRLFAAVIGVSSLAYVEAFLNTKQESFIQGNVNALKYYDASPIYVVPDNDKSAVLKASNCDPIINPTYLDMTRHYDMIVWPARKITPTDKATVEKAVLDIAERGVIDYFRNITFFSIESLNNAIFARVHELNSKPLQKEKHTSRTKKYFEIDKPAMQQLPSDHYEYGIFKIYTVHMDYHIEVSHKCYSVPYTYVNKKVDVKITATKIYIYYQSKEIACHTIITSLNQRYSTEKEHMPRKHREFIDQNKENFISWAKSIADEAQLVVNGIFDNCRTVEYGYRPCLGLQRLYRTYGKTSFINACKNAVNSSIYNYRFIENSIKNLKLNVDLNEKIIPHDNIRGRDSYINAGGNNN